MKTLDNPDEAFEALGYKTIETPDGESLTSAPAEEQPVEEPQVEVPETPVEEPKAKEVSEEELKRRSFQAEADRAKADLEREKERSAMLQAQNAQTLAMMKEFTQKYDTPKQETAMPEPNFINELGEFDPAKHAEWLKSRDSVLVDKASEKSVANFQQLQERQKYTQQALELCAAHPEYKDPLTGQPDYNKIELAIRKKTGGMTLSQMLSGETRPPDKSFEAIQERADKPASVVTAQETQETPKEVPQDVKTVFGLYGDIDLPPDYAP